MSDEKEVFIDKNDNLANILDGLYNEHDAVIDNLTQEQLYKLDIVAPEVTDRSTIVSHTNAYIVENAEPNLSPLNVTSNIDTTHATDITIAFPTINNVEKYMHMEDNKDDNECKTSALDKIALIFDTMIETCEEAPDIAKPYLAKVMFMYATQHINFLLKYKLYALLIKALFHQYITIHRCLDLVPLYDIIYNDKLYTANSKHVFTPVLTQEWMDTQIKAYQLECTHIEWRKKAKKQTPKYEVNEIVGAKDKEGKWWMSRVLSVFTCQEHTVYYVEFLGWGDKFNEFISDSYRIEYFKPKKHRYYRPAWRKNNIDEINNIGANSKPKFADEVKDNIMTT
jgi:hypothetical protein